MGKLAYSNIDEVYKDFNIIDSRKETNEYAYNNYNNNTDSIKNKNEKKYKISEYNSDINYTSLDNSDNSDNLDNSDNSDNSDKQYNEEEVIKEPVENYNILNQNTEELFKEFKSYLRKNKNQINEEFKENVEIEIDNNDTNINKIKFEYTDIIILFIIGIILIVVMDSFVKIGKKMNN